MNSFWSNIHFVTDRLTKTSVDEVPQKLPYTIPQDYMQMLTSVGLGSISDILILLNPRIIAAHEVHNRQSMKKSSPELSSTDLTSRDLGRVIMLVDAMYGHGIYFHPDRPSKLYFHHAGEGVLHECRSGIEHALALALAVLRPEFSFHYFRPQCSFTNFELYHPAKGNQTADDRSKEAAQISDLEEPERSIRLRDEYSLFYPKYGAQIINCDCVGRLLAWYDPTKENDFIPCLVSKLRRLGYSCGSLSDPKNLGWIEEPDEPVNYAQMDLDFGTNAPDTASKG